MKSIFFTSLLFTAAAQACDLCGTTLIEHPWDPRAGFTIGASEQFSRMHTFLDNGHEIDNDADQKLDSSITQIFVGYHITPRFGVQVNVPLIRRTFRRATETGLENGRVQGLGDISVTANYLVIDHHSGDFSFHLGVSAGIKFPTGDNDRLQEEGAEGHTHAEAPAATDESAATAGGHADRSVRHATHEHPEPAPTSAAVAAADEPADPAEEPEPLPDGIHGHDLALGTGSIDGIFGGAVRATWKRLFFTGEVQYALRGDGAHSYDFADDFSWTGGPGVTLIEKETHTVSIQFVCSGETKGEDRYHGVKSSDTQLTQVFLGPSISGTWRDHFSAEVALDIPVYRDNSGVQAVPDYRLRAAMSWAF